MRVARALPGVSGADAEKPQAAFGVKTVRDVATNRHFPNARVIFLLSGSGR